MHRLLVCIALSWPALVATAAAQTPLLEFDFNETNALAFSNGSSSPIATFKDASGLITNLHSAAGAGVAGGLAFDNTASTGMGSGNTGGTLQGTLQQQTTLKSLTITGWMKNVSASFGSGSRMLFFRNAAGDAGIDLMWDGTGRLRLDVTPNVPGAGSPVNAYAQALTSWTFFAVTFDGTKANNQVSFYVGQTASATTLAGQGTVAATTAATTGPFGIGNLADGWALTAPFDGMLDNIRLFGSSSDASGALSLVQVEALRQRDLINRGPVAQWKLDEGTGATSTDSYLYANTATLMNGAAWTYTAIQGQAIYLDGSDDYLRVEDANSLDLSDQFTLSAWVKTTRSGQLQTILSKDGVDTDTTGAYNLYVTASQALEFEINNSSALFTPTNLVPVDKWTHVAVSHDAASSPTTRIYVNGSEVASGNLPAPQLLGTRFLIGRRGVGSNFQGYVDNIEVFNNTATPATVSRLFARDRPPAVSLVNPVAAQVLSGSVVLQADAADDVSVKEVEFYADGSSLCVDRTSPYQCTFNTASVSNGSHTLSVVARDSGGNSSAIADADKELRVIEWGWDQPATSYVRDNYLTMQQAPLDGFAVLLSDNLSISPFTNTAHSLSAVQSDIDNLLAVTFSRPMDLFAVAYASTGAFPTVPDWFDSWTTPLANIALLGKVSKDGHLKGILFDPETYGASIFDYESQAYKTTKTLVQYQAQARLRGQQVMASLNSTFSAVTLLCTYGFTIPNSPNYELLTAFMVGMLEGADAGTQLHELGEPAYAFTKEQQYTDLRARFLAQASDALGSSALLKKYAVGVGKWMDTNSSTSSDPMFQWNANLTNTQANYYPPKLANANSAGWQQEIMSGLLHTDRYVWIYTERPDWWLGTNLATAYKNATRDAADTVRNRSGSSISVVVSH